MWFEATGRDNDVVMGSKAFIVRNVKGFPFPEKMSRADNEALQDKIREAVNDEDKVFLKYSELDEAMRANLAMQLQLPIPKIGKDPDSVGVVLSRSDEGLSVRVNQNDHVLVRKYLPGSALAEAYYVADGFAADLERKLDMAYSDKLGFLTTDITRCGNGIVLAMDVALPGIENTASAMSILRSRLDNADWKIIPRPDAGNDRASAPAHGLYMMMSLATQGITERELITNAVAVTNEVVAFERNCRKNLHKRKPRAMDDTVYRAYGMLTYARRLQYDEALEGLATIRIGLDQLKEPEFKVDHEMLDSLTYRIVNQCNDLGTTSARNTPKMMVDRAEMIRNTLRGESAK